MRGQGLARYRDRVGHLNRLREQYRFVLLDCHSLTERTDVLGLAPVVDGTITIVECNRTRSSQLHELEHSIEKYGGSIVGSVLNKTTDTVPRWLNSLMERVGI
jgi:Mrp family chromosome partitioning ATPase